jgi:HAE1 family hydrophobic/amphiphilic exporter-1
MMQNSVGITVSGEDSESLSRTAAEIAVMLEGIDGLVNIKNDIADVIPQPQLEVDPSRVAQYGLGPEQLEAEVGLLMRGGVVSQLNLDGESYDVFVAPVMQGVETLEQLQELRLGSTQMVTLGDIASIEFELEPTHIRHVDQRRSTRITASITEEDVGAVNRKVDEGIDALPIPPGVEVKVGGVFEEMAESFRWMGIAILAAIGISYLIIVLTFRSFLNPFVIMFSLPVASIGALFGLFITGRPLGISAMMGVLMLVGIVLTNAIVLMSLVDQLRKRGFSTYDALVEGGSTRLRPILMTAITTMIALVPLALGFGEGTIIAAELATVVIGGLFTSTLLTLLVVPVVYSLVEGLRQRVRRT